MVDTVTPLGISCASPSSRKPEGCRGASLGWGSVLLDQPIFDLESWNTLEVAHISRHNRILPDQGSRANEHIFHANQLAASCQMGKNVPRNDCLGDTQIKDGHPGQHLIGDPLPEDRVILTPAAPMTQFTQGVGIQQIHTVSDLPAGGRVGDGSPGLLRWCRSW